MTNARKAAGAHAPVAHTSPPEAEGSPVGRAYGWKPDVPDARDLPFAAIHASHAPVLPARVSLRDQMPPVFDQGELGSCTANALCGALGFLDRLPPASAGEPEGFFIGARLQVYYDEREIEKTVREDAGARLRDGIKVLHKQGAAPEADWPYDVRKFATRPPAAVMSLAAAHRISRYARLKGLEDYRQCLAAGHPFVIGIVVFESFESEAVARHGAVPMPQPDEAQLGGHAVCVIGYDRQGPNGDCFEVRNSWGAAWGDHGNFWIPAGYLGDPALASDAWTLRR